MTSSQTSVEGQPCEDERDGPALVRAGTRIEAGARGKAAGRGRG